MQSFNAGPGSDHDGDDASNTAGRVVVLLGLVGATVVVGWIVAAIAGPCAAALARALSGTGEAPGIGEVARSVVDALESNTNAVFRGSTLGLITLACMLPVALAPALIAAPAVGASPDRPRSLGWSIAGASILGGLIAVGIMATLMDAAFVLLSPAPGGSSGTQQAWSAFIWSTPLLFVSWAVAGGCWAAVLAHAGKAHDPGRLDRWVRWLFAGSCVELALAAPTLVAALRRDKCECSWGCWWAIVAGSVTIAILCGPAIILLRSRKARMQWIRGVCGNCGYPRRGGAVRCPECGAALEPAAPAAQ